MSEGRWTAEIPTKPGWYWWVNNWNADPLLAEPTMTHLVWEDGPESQLMAMNDEPRDIRKWLGLWWGPETPPLSPQQRGIIMQQETVSLIRPSEGDWAHVIAEMVEFQAQVSAHQDGPTRLTPDTTRAFFLALIVETCETLQTLNWKPWKQVQPVSPIMAQGEAADMMAFFLQTWNLVCQATGLTPADLVHAYLEKSRVNVERLSGRVEGYGGPREGRAV